MASRGCPCTRTHRALPPPHDTQGPVTKTKSTSLSYYSVKPSTLGSSSSNIQQQSPSCLFNHSFWACVAETKELQNIFSTFER